MTDQLAPASELLAAIIPRLAARLNRRYPGVPAADMEQQLWMSALERAPRIRELAAEGGDAAERKIRDILYRGGRALGREDERYRRAKKAAAAGYSPEDEQFYSQGLLRILLPLYVDNGVTDAPPKGRSQDGGRTPSDGSERLGYLTMMIDIDEALKRLRAHQRNLLLRYFALPQGDTGDELFTRQQMASSMGMTYDALRQRVTRALGSLQQELGGPSPWPRKR